MSSTSRSEVPDFLCLLLPFSCYSKEFRQHARQIRKSDLGVRVETAVISSEWGDRGNLNMMGDCFLHGQHQEVGPEACLSLPSPREPRAIAAVLCMDHKTSLSLAYAANAQACGCRRACH